MNWISAASGLCAKGEVFVMISLVEINGSAPQDLGARAFVNHQGLISGSVGGGKVEAKAIALAQDLLRANEPSSKLKIVSWNLKQDVGMTCGGVVTLLFEVFHSQRWQIAVFGAGHVAQELVPLLTRLDCQVTCLDTRREWLEKLPEAPNLQSRHADNLAAEVKNFSGDTFFVLMTQGHATDLPILTEILNRHTPPYIGVIGSESKAAVLRANLRDLGFSKEQQRSFYCPIGLNLGGNTPVEIAVSVCAQLLLIRDHSLDRQIDRGIDSMQNIEFVGNHLT